MTTVYLIHFDRPISPGYTTHLHDRLDAHASGRGARLMAVARERGIGWTLVRTWAGGTRGIERRLKRSKFLNRLCPICCPATTRALRIVLDGAVVWQRERIRRPTKYQVASHQEGG